MLLQQKIVDQMQFQKLLSIWFHVRFLKRIAMIHMEETWDQQKVGWSPDTYNDN